MRAATSVLTVFWKSCESWPTSPPASPRTPAGAAALCMVRLYEVAAEEDIGARTPPGHIALA